MYYYVLQTDQTLHKYLDNAKERATNFLTNSTMSAMDWLSAASLNAAHIEDAEEDEEGDDDDLMAADDGLEIEEDWQRPQGRTLSCNFRRSVEISTSMITFL